MDLHTRRKTFGTALVLNGEHPRVVMEAMRHSAINPADQCLVADNPGHQRKLRPPPLPRPV